MPRCTEHPSDTAHALAQARQGLLQPTASTRDAHVGSYRVSASGRSVVATVVTLLLALVMLAQAGCLGLAANLVHAVGADKIPAKYKDLKDSRVAIVTVTDSSQYRDDVAARLLSRRVGEILTTEVKGLTLVREDQVEQWRDTNGWDSIDFLSIGQGVKADKVLGIELTNVRLQDGATLYRGRANVLINVIDAKTGDVLFKQEIEEYTFPTSAGQYTTETTEAKFQRLYLSMLAKEIARMFYPYDFSETVALDGAIASQ